jgi:hypothetical protein
LNLKSEKLVSIQAFAFTFNLYHYSMGQMSERIASLSNVLGSSKTPQLGSGQWFKDLVPDGWFK